ncbi:cytochrome P450 21 [Stachybotrys elegans]|uniref:Cytochrome P450 21 n=1 Tax=Stachybotrys elegans TaxID=80388 RepID=A0A8K0WPI7_9HYPO|nr:cytochrome P450 21 [Stachybotrys elegans]
MEVHVNVWLWPSLVAILLYFSGSAIRFLLSTRRPHNFPPGPPSILGLGNLHQVPPKHPFLQFHEWFQTYGDIVGIKLGPKNVVLLNNPMHAQELFARRATKYSGRPQNPFLSDFVLKPQHPSWFTLNYDSRFKKWRTAARHILSPEGINRAGPVQSALAARFLHELLQDPSCWTGSSRRWALGFALVSVYGQTLDKCQPGFSDEYFRVQHDFLEILEPNNAPPIEIFPILRYVPSFLAKWKHRTSVLREKLYNVYDTNLEGAKVLFRTESYQHEPLVPHLLRKREMGDKLSMSDDELTLFAGGLLEGAVDTTLSALSSVLLCLTAHPEVMRRAQAEIDERCGNRFPGFGDMEQLPYMKACVLEVFRWRGAVQFSLPHLVTEDDVFEGYYIPRGTTVLGSTYSMHLRTEDFDQPQQFNPERYMHNPYGVRRAPSDMGERRKPIYSFGVGRRACAGEDLAWTMVLMMTTRVIWAFDCVVEGKIDLSWDTGYSAGVVNAPRNFNPRLKLRINSIGAEIEREFAASEAYLAVQGLM